MPVNTYEHLHSERVGWRDTDSLYGAGLQILRGEYCRRCALVQAVMLVAHISRGLVTLEDSPVVIALPGDDDDADAWLTATVLAWLHIREHYTLEDELSRHDAFAFDQIVAEFRELGESGDPPEV